MCLSSGSVLFVKTFNLASCHSFYNFNFRCLGTSPSFSAILQRVMILKHPDSLPGGISLPKMGSSHRGKNLLLQEQILSFMR